MKYTTNRSMKEPEGTDLASIADINYNTDIIDGALLAEEKSLAIVSKNNTHDAIAKGEYVYVYGHASLSEGLYVASATISANVTLSTTNLTAVSKGGLNALNSNLSVVTSSSSFTFESGITVTHQRTIKYGKIVFVYFRITCTSAFASQATIATLAYSCKGWTQFNLPSTNNNLAVGHMTNGGTALILDNAISAGSMVVCFGAYATDD